MPSIIHSFDVFDTVLTRTVGDPHAVFFYVGLMAQRQGILVEAPSRFKQLRIEAEAAARQARGNDDICLREIYDCLARLMPLAPDQAQALQQLEIDLESSGLRPVKLAMKEISAARAANGSVAFLSDMYLPARLIETRLRDYGLFKDGDQLWVSGECRATKESGDLYRAFLAAAGIKPEQLTHRGDNLASDVQTPRRLGIRAEHFKTARLNRYERILEGFSDQTNAITSFLAGASRLVRLERPADSRNEAALREVAAGVAGPVLLAYVVWLLQTAQKQKLNRLFFLARDGQILLEIARLCAPVLKYEGKLEYLFASRQSWRLPAMEAGDGSIPDWVFENTDFLSPRSFLERVGLCPAEIELLLFRHGFGTENWDQTLGPLQRERLRSLAKEPGFIERVASVAISRKQQFLAYLGEQGVLDGENFGIVDLGWNGTLQRSLEQALGGMGVPPPVGFYFGLSQRTSEQVAERSYAYFFDERLGAGCLRRNYWVEPMMEVFCAADHGLTLRFERRDGKMQPVLKTMRNEPALVWGLGVVQNAILEFVEVALANLTDTLEPDNLRPAIDALLDEFWNLPTRAEAEAWGRYVYADDQTESDSREWAEPLGVFDVLRSVYRGQLTPPHKAGWASASLSRSHRIFRWMLPHAVKVGTRLRNQS
jgi:FMN phosphatase YigB (HAD superfamily)